MIESIIAFTAVCLTLTHGILRLSNFAHADLYCGFNLTWVANIGGIVAMIIAEYLLWKPMCDRRATSTTLIVISIGLALFIRNGILMIWGGNNQSYKLPLVLA